MEGENSNIEKGLLRVNTDDETSAKITPLLVFTTFIIVSASFTFGVAVSFHLYLSLYIHTIRLEFKILGRDVAYLKTS